VTLRGLQDAYIDEGLMLTPTPEWHTGENHSVIKVNEFYDFFDIPQESDYEPEAWQALINDAKKYDYNSTSILVVFLPTTNKVKIGGNQIDVYNNQFAAWDDPRTESKYLFTTPKSQPKSNFDSLLGRGVVLNRPDLIAAVKPYTRGARSLIQAAIGADVPAPIPPRGGALSPAVDLPPASPPGLP